MRKVAYIFLLIFVLLAFADMRFSAGGKGIFTLSLFEFWAYMTVIPLLSTATWDRLSIPSSKWLLLYIIWSLAAMLMFWDSPDYAIQLDIKRLMPGVIAYVALLTVVTGRTEMRKVQICWFVAGVVNALLAFSQYFFHGPYPVEITESAFEKTDFSGEVTDVLVTGFFGHPNGFAQLIIPWFVVAAIIWLTSDRLMAAKSWGWFLLSALFGAVLVFTEVKAAILWSVVGVLLGISMYRWKRMRSIAVLVLIWIVLIIGVDLLAFHLHEDYDVKELGTLFSRIEFITTGYHLFVDNLLAAVIGGGLRYWEKYEFIWSTSTGYMLAHNSYLNQMLMYGFIGISALAGLLLSSLRCALRASVAERGLFSPFPYVGALFAQSAEYFFEPSFNYALLKYQMFFLLATLVLVARLAPSMEPDKERVDMHHRRRFVTEDGTK